MYEQAKAAGVPDEHLSLFAGPGASFLMAVKDRAGQA